MFEAHRTRTRHCVVVLKHRELTKTHVCRAGESIFCFFFCSQNSAVDWTVAAAFMIKCLCAHGFNIGRCLQWDERNWKKKYVIYYIMYTNFKIKNLQRFEEKNVREYENKSIGFHVATLVIFVSGISWPNLTATSTSYLKWFGPVIFFLRR